LTPPRYSITFDLTLMDPALLFELAQGLERLRLTESCSVAEVLLNGLILRPVGGAEKALPDVGLRLEGVRIRQVVDAMGRGDEPGIFG
jgi:hypothetical protein